ncbi:MAG: diguanylate cyclase [Myxococcota bacterium]|nr:diguanylate cyclase [Myxococcota bacterium]
MTPVNENDLSIRSRRAQLERLYELLLRARHKLFFPPFYESQFRKYYAKEFESARRVTICIGATICLAMGILDKFFLGENWIYLILFRHIVAGSLLVGSVLFTFTQHFRQNQQLTIVAVQAIVTVVLTSLIAVAPQQAALVYFSGLILLVLFSTAVARLHLVRGLISTLIIGLTYFSVIVWFDKFPVEILFGHLLFYLAAAILGLAAEYLMERSVRVDYLQNRIVTLLNEELHQVNAQLSQQAKQDGLTGLANRFHFDQVLKKEWLRAQRDNFPLSLLLLDLDYFKAYNDTYGHQAGDVCLTQTAQQIKQVARRPGDLAARYGGEEFVVILTDTDLNSAKLLATQINSDIFHLGIPHSNSRVAPYVTASVGCATIIPTNTDQPEELIERADQALYTAKTNGRNQIWQYANNQYALKSS